jgi:hypothetical protein
MATIRIQEIDNGFVIAYDLNEVFAKNPKAVVNVVRELLGLKKVGRPKRNKLGEAAEAPF